MSKSLSRKERKTSKYIKRDRERKNKELKNSLLTLKPQEIKELK